MKISDLKIGDYISFIDYNTGERIIGIMDKITGNGDYHVFQNTSNTHRRWFKIYASEIISYVKITEEPIEQD